MPNPFSYCKLLRLPIAAVVVPALVAACVPVAGISPGSAPQVVDKPVETATPAETAPPPPPPPAPEEQAVAHAIEGEQQIIVADAPWALVRQAERAPAEQVASLLLPAISGFIELGQIDIAQTLVGQLQTQPITAFQRRSLKLYQAQLAQARGRHSRAIGLLRLLEQSPDLSAQTSAKRLLLLADSQQALHRNAEALATLLRLDRLPEQPNRAANQQRILALIDSLDPLSRLLLRESPPDDAVTGWIALSEILRFAPPEDRTTGIQQWRALYREHPAEQLLLDQRLLTDESVQYKHIAMLLPLTSPFGKAARAFYEGFIASRNADHSVNRPEVSLHDIGEDPSLVSLYYRAAISDGADFMVGPLGRQAVNALLAGAPTELPTLMIGNVPDDKTAPNLYGISLSPEQEAGQVAERAFLDGHRQAGVFASESEWGQRVAAAFARRWEALGGTVVENVTFPRDISGYPRTIQKLLGLDKSVARERILSIQLEANLQFTPRRRDDIDFLFLAANAGEARLLVPQLRFFQAHDLALYATSTVYSGKPNPATDADLDGIIFGDMDWMLDAAVLPPEPEPALELEAGAGADADAVASAMPEGEFGADWDATIGMTAGAQPTPPTQPAQPTQPTPTPATPAQPPPLLPFPLREPGPYYHTDLDRLYALGLESYRLIPGLEALRNNQWQRYYGKAVDISVQADGNVRRHLTWARFDRGLPVPLPGTTAGLRVPAPPSQ